MGSMAVTKDGMRKTEMTVVVETRREERRREERRRASQGVGGCAVVASITNQNLF
jgi:hypothetical protein